MKHEILRKSFAVAFDRLIQNAGFNPVELRKIPVQHHLLSPDEVDAALNLFHFEIFVTRSGIHKED